MADTTLRLYAGVPLTRDNLNFLNNFTSESQQLSVFGAYQVKEYGTGAEPLAPIRRSFDSIVVDSPIEEVDNVNYMTFKNGSSQRYWCFVTDVVYESESSSRVYFEIDYMTTWYLSIDFSKSSLIEREHVADDAVGLHLVDENITTGDYTIRATDTILDLNPLAILVSSSWNPDTNSDVVGDNYSGIYSGTALFAFDRITGITALNLFLLDVVADNKADAITSIFMIPKNLLPSFTDGDQISVPNSLTIDFNYNKNTTDIDGYTPKNNKLFVYPYNFLYVTNHNGLAAEFQYEYSSQANMQFYVTCNVTPNPVVALVPKQYKGAFANFDEILRIADYPQCSWTIDSFLQYVANAAVSTPVNVAGAFALGAATGGVGAIAAVPSVVNAITGGVQAARQPNQVRGSITGGGNTGIGIQTFGFYPKTIRAEHAKIIDDMFTKFGYRVNRLSSIDVNKRPKFDYVKTIDCNIQGSIPSKDLQEIRNMFNKGVTFWHTTDVGNYDVTNTP